MYLTTSQHDITFSMCNSVRYQANAREPHLTSVKNIFHYLHGTKTLGLWYPSKIRFFIQAFSDADLGVVIDRKRTSRGCQFLYGKLVS